MRSNTRRNFMRTSAATIGLAATSFANRLPAATCIRRPIIGFISCGGRSKNLLQGFAADAEIAWACDPDESRAADFQKRSGAKQVTSDLRRVLDDKSVDAVVVSTPDHWHAPAAIMACDAGKHVYVEKPCSHNLIEGRLLVDAARRNQVVVQHGTQSRTNPFIVNAIQLLREGAIGEVLMAKAWNVQRRKNIGHHSPSTPPATLDYDTWVGPAEMVPYQTNRLHYNWHWWYNFGTGDIGNDGAHELDIARWGLGVTGLPSSVSAMGGKYYFDDDQEFPDTATCAFEWPGAHSVGQRKQIIFEMRIWSRNLPYNCDTGIEFYGTDGMLFVSKRGKIELWDDANKPVPNPQPNESISTPKNHQVDFLEAIVEGRDPAADIAIGHDSVALIHLANIALRRGRWLNVDPANEKILDDPRSDAMRGRSYRAGGHWSLPAGV